MKIRDFRYIYNSKIDFIELWINLVILLFGITLIFNNDVNLIIEKQYQITVIMICIFLSSLAIIKIFLPFKPSQYLSILLKCVTFALLIYIMTIFYNSSLSLWNVGFVTMLAVLILDNIRRT